MQNKIYGVQNIGFAAIIRANKYIKIRRKRYADGVNKALIRPYPEIRNDHATSIAHCDTPNRPAPGRRRAVLTAITMSGYLIKNEPKILICSPMASTAWM